MIRLKSMRLSGVNSANLAGPSTTTITAKDCEMIYFPSDEFVACRRVKSGEEFLIPTADISYMQPMMPLEEQLRSDLWEKKAPEPVVAAPLEILAPPTAVAPERVYDEDTVRMVKINGVIVERKGAPRADELASVTPPEPTDEELEQLTAPTTPERGIFSTVDESDEGDDE